MKALTLEQTLAWIAQHPSLSVDGRGLRYQNADTPALHFHFPTGEGQLIYFARLLTSLHHEESEFAGALFWFTEWGIWPEWTENVGYKAVAMFRSEKAGLANFRESPGQLFGSHELLEAAAFLVLPMLVGWDAYYCPTFKDRSPDFIVKV